MDTKSFKKKADDEPVQEEVKTVDSSNLNNKLENLNKTIYSKDEEIKRLRAQVAEAKKVNLLKKGDIRAEVNRQGDVKLIKIGVDDFGRPVWKKANLLTDADIQRREDYIQTIKQNNAKKY